MDDVIGPNIDNMIDFLQRKTSFCGLNDHQEKLNKTKFMILDNFSVHL